MYERGVGVDQSMDAAIEWYRRAAAKNDERAIASLEIFNLCLEA